MTEHTQPTAAAKLPTLGQIAWKLTKLLEWDMLTLDADGRGAATSDAPWARGVIGDVLTDLEALRAAGLLPSDTQREMPNAWLRGDRKAAWCTTHGDLAWQFSDGSVSCHHELVVGSSTGDECRVELLNLGLTLPSSDTQPSTEALEAALAFYADPETWKLRRVKVATSPSGFDVMGTRIRALVDEGERARAALTWIGD